MSRQYEKWLNQQGYVLLNSTNQWHYNNAIVPVDVMLAKRKEWLTNKKFVLKHGRYEYHETKGKIAVHDLYVNSEIVLHGKPYTTCYNYALQNMLDTDFYTEPDACPDYIGDCGKVLREKDRAMNQEIENR